MPVLQYPIATEKALNMVDKENIITYVVNFNADKKAIKKEFEDSFKVKVKKVNTVILPHNAKRAYIRISKEYQASDIAKRLKLV